MSLRQVSEGAFLRHCSNAYVLTPLQQHPTPSPTPQNREKTSEIPVQFSSNWWHKHELFVPILSAGAQSRALAWPAGQEGAALQCRDTEPPAVPAAQPVPAALPQQHGHSGTSSPALLQNLEMNIVCTSQETGRGGLGLTEIITPSLRSIPSGIHCPHPFQGEKC